MERRIRFTIPAGGLHPPKNTSTVFTSRYYLLWYLLAVVLDGNLLSVMLVDSHLGHFLFCNFLSQSPSLTEPFQPQSSLLQRRSGLRIGSPSFVAGSVILYPVTNFLAGWFWHFTLHYFSRGKPKYLHTSSNLVTWQP